MTREFSDEIEIRASPGAVFKALTDAEELSRWLVESADIEPRPGGSYHLTFNDGLDMQARIQSIDPDRRLRLQTDLPTPVPIVQEFLIEAHGETTTLRVVTSGIPDAAEWDGFYEGGRKGWQLSFASLRHYLERHLGQPRRTTTLRSTSALAADQLWQRVAGEIVSPDVLVSVEGFGLIARVPELGDALLALGIQPTPAGTRVWVALSTFGGHEASSRDISRLQNILKGV